MTQRNSSSQWVVTLLLCVCYSALSQLKSSNENSKTKVMRTKANFVVKSSYLGLLYYIKTSLQELTGSFQSTRNLFTYHAHTCFQLNTINNNYQVYVDSITPRIQNKLVESNMLMFKPDHLSINPFYSEPLLKNTEVDPAHLKTQTLELHKFN